MVIFEKDQPSSHATTAYSKGILEPQAKSLIGVSAIERRLDSRDTVVSTKRNKGDTERTPQSLGL